jgi:Zn-dependent peptidase ImmA (M78 family)
MKPLRPRYSRIRREVADLLAGASISQPPVPVDRIAVSLGAQITYSNFNGEVSGLLVRRAGSVVIGVHSEQAETRKRFTIAHEIGHLIMHEADDGEEVHVDKLFRVHLRSPASSTAEDVAEIEANAFAAALLMPEEMVREDVRKLTLDFEDPQDIQRLAERYGVSSQAMTFRLLNLFPAQRG